MLLKNKEILSVNNTSNKMYFGLAVLLHIVLGLLLFFKFDKTINIQPAAMAPAKPIIDAVAINESEISHEVSRLENIEKQKRQKEKERQQALQKQKDDAIRLRKQEEARTAKLKQEQEKLKEEQQKIKLAEEKQKQERIEKEKLAEKEAKEKLEKEKVALEKIKQEKEALLKEKQKIEEAKKQAEAEKKRAEAEKLKQAEAEALAKAQAQKAEAERLENLRTSQVIIDKTMQHAALIGNKVMQNWRQPVGMEIQGLKCKLAVRLSPTGDVLEAYVKESSGNVEFDRSSELAVRKASPLPLPEDKAVLENFMKFTFTFNPEAA